MKIEDEALWAIQELKRQRAIRPEDSALMFVSWNVLDTYLDSLKNIWAHPNALHAIAIKSQPHIEVLRHIVQRGFGLEAATWEEVQLARKAGCPAHKIVFDSPVKRPHEIADCAKKSKGMLLNANSLEELKRLSLHSADIKIGLRINAMADTGAPSVYDVSQNHSKFGEPIIHRKEILQAILEYPIQTLHIHSASSVKNLEEAAEAVAMVVELAQEANEKLCKNNVSHRITQIDVGGGMVPEALNNGHGNVMKTYVDLLRKKKPALWTDFRLVTEFGQWVHFHTGYAYSDVEYVLVRGSKQLVYIHLGADFLLRDAYVSPRGIIWLPLRNGQKLIGDFCDTDIAGPLCFAGDFLERGVSLPKISEGDGMLMLGTGSNAYALWSRHTSRSIPAMYGVDFKNRKINLLSDRFNPFV